METRVRKLSIEQRAEILRRLEAGESPSKLAPEYDVSVSAIRKVRDTDLRRRGGGVKSEGKEQTYRENLAWAMASAGEFLRTKKKPTTCPNDAAWFLFRQAIDNPKDFMAKVGQVEARADDGEAERNARLAAQRSIQEIDAMLADLALEAEHGP